MPVLSELSQRVARFAIINKELHVGSATRKMVAGRCVPNILHHIGMCFDSLDGAINIVLTYKEIIVLTRLYLYGAPV
jgi:hypothetical protein